jgi:hypothetical protein
MNIYRTETKLILGKTEKLEAGDWTPLLKLELDGGLILSDVSDDEHDKILNIHDFSDPEGLRGIVAALHVENGNDDPTSVNLALQPQKGQVIRHQDRYYLILLVIQSTSFSVAILAKRVDQSELWKLSALV